MLNVPPRASQLRPGPTSDPPHLRTSPLNRNAVYINRPQVTYFSASLAIRLKQAAVAASRSPRSAVGHLPSPYESWRQGPAALGKQGNFRTSVNFSGLSREMQPLLEARPLLKCLF